MAYVVVSIGGEELSRHPLSGPTVIGRSVDAGVSVRDASMSRWHCRIEPAGDPQNVWVVIDLGSRNGTSLNGRRVTRHVLHTGDLLRIGRVTVAFSAGDLANVRPYDRIDAPSTVRAECPLPRSAPAGFSRPMLVPSDRLPRPLPGQPNAKKVVSPESTALLSSPGWSRGSRRPPSPSVDILPGELSPKDERSKTVDLVHSPTPKSALERDEAPSRGFAGLLKKIGRLFRR